MENTSAQDKNEALKMTQLTQLTELLEHNKAQ